MENAKWRNHNPTDFGTSFQMKKYLRKKMGGAAGHSKNDVMHVNIQPEDDTDYTQQWTRRMRRAQVSHVGCHVLQLVSMRNACVCFFDGRK